MDETMNLDIPTLQPFIDEGMEQGRKQGREERTKEIAKAMLKEKFSIESIMKMTNLSEQELREIKSQMS